jgi:hypothetical protein
MLGSVCGIAPGGGGLHGPTPLFIPLPLLLLKTVVHQDWPNTGELGQECKVVHFKVHVHQ